MRVFDIITDTGEIFYSVPAVYLTENEIITVQIKDVGGDITLKDVKVEHILAVRDIDDLDVDL